MVPVHNLALLLLHTYRMRGKLMENKSYDGFVNDPCLAIDPLTIQYIIYTVH